MELENNLNNSKEITIEKEQTKFINTTFGKAINTAIDMGLRYVLPDLIENQVIDVKNALIQNGLKDGINTAINSAVDLGKSALGLITGRFENVSQIKTAIGNGGIVDTVSSVLDSAINKSYQKGLIDKTTSSLIRQGKEIILNGVSNNIENTLEEQTNAVEKLSKYVDNWKLYYESRNFDGMTREYNKIREKLKQVVPLENVLKETREVETLHNLIKNNGKNFDLSNEQLELVEKLK